MTAAEKRLLDVAEVIEFRIKMKLYIREHFADILGDDIDLLDAPDGLDLLKQKVDQMISEKWSGTRVRTAA